MQKMLFYITALGFASYLRNDPPVATTDPPTREEVLAVQSWWDADYNCKNILLNGLDGKLYDVFALSAKTAK
jgi:hypothetical protein